MYNNLLISYWSLEELKNVIIVGNDYRMANSFPEKSLKEIPAICTYTNLCNSVSMPEIDEFPVAFSCTCLMWLDGNVRHLPVDLRNFVPEYNYFKAVDV